MKRPLSNKSSFNVARALKDIIFELDVPTIIQCDNGKDFKGAEKTLSRKYGIHMSHPSPYHTNAKGSARREETHSKQWVQLGKKGFKKLL